MGEAAPGCRGVAKVFRSRHSQVVRPPAASEVEVIKEGDQAMLRLRRDWAAFFDAESCGTLPQRRQPPLDGRDDIRSRF